MLLLIALATGVPAAMAGASDSVAPAGVCAESRRTAITPDPDPGYAVAGVPAGRFSAASVSNPGVGPPLAPPPSTTSPRFRGIGPCETGGSGCTQVTPANQPSRSGDSGFPFVPPRP